MGQVFHGQSGCRLGLQDGRSRLPGLQRLAAQGGHTFKVLALCRVLQQLQLQVDVVPVLFQFWASGGDIRVPQVHVRAGLVQQVDGLIRQKAVCDIALREQDSLPGDLRRNFNPVERFVIVGDAPQDGCGLLQGRLIDRHRLEAALQGGVLFDILPVFVECRRADDLDLAPGEGGLEDIGRVHRALGVPRADEVVHLVDDENDVAHAP